MHLHQWALPVSEDEEGKELVKTLLSYGATEGRISDDLHYDLVPSTHPPHSLHR